VSGPNTPFETPGISLRLIDAVEGTYEFMLTVTDNDSLTATDNVTILVTPQGEGITIAKVITPNGDQYNQTWKIGNVEAINGCLVSIFTREGRKVYETTSYDNSWSGIATNGQVLHDGDYYYVIKCDGAILASGGVRIIR
jgi:gliding motility-associated-like protein